MEKQRRLVAMAFIAGLLSVILSAGIAWAGPSFDPHTADGGLPQCKADLATCMTTIDQTQTNYEACMDDLKDCTSLSGVIQVPRTGQLVRAKDVERRRGSAKGRDVAHTQVC